MGIIDNMTQRWPQQDEDLIIDCGDTVALEVNGIDVVVNSKRTQVFSPDVFTQFGINIVTKHLLVVKSIQHFYGGFSPIASEILYAAAPGAVAPVMKDIPFTRVNLNKFPWVDDPFFTE